MKTVKKLLELFRALTMSDKAACAVTVIGGADGPTSVFLAGKVNTRDLYMTAAVIIVFVLLSAAAVVWQIRRHKKGRDGE